MQCYFSYTAGCLLGSHASSRKRQITVQFTSLQDFGSSIHNLPYITFLTRRIWTRLLCLWKNLWPPALDSVMRFHHWLELCLFWSRNWIFRYNLDQRFPKCAPRILRYQWIHFFKGRFTLYVTFPFHRGTSPFSKIFLCVIKWRCSHWQERLPHVSVPFRRRCQARMFDVTERVRTGPYLLDSDNVSSLTSPPLHFECLLVTSAACFCLQKLMKN